MIRNLANSFGLFELQLMLIFIILHAQPYVEKTLDALANFCKSLSWNFELFSLKNHFKTR